MGTDSPKVRLRKLYRLSFACKYSTEWKNMQLTQIWGLTQDHRQF